MNFFKLLKSALGYLLTQSKDTCIRCCFLPVFLLLISTSISAHLPHGLTKETVGSLNRFVYEDGNQAPLLVSDDYDRANLDLIRWSFVNPLNDGWVAMTGTNTIDAYLELSVPEGQSHDPWQINRSVRAMQDAPDNDFEVDIKFASEPDPNLRYQQQGIIVEESNDNWLRFDLFSNGSGLRIFAASTVNGSSSAKLNVAVNPGEATYLRVGRTGDTWTFSYSGDGQTWTTAGSFSHAMAVSSVGPFAANHNTGGNPSPAFTAQVDYFFNTASPISPEDDGEETDVWEPFIHTTSTTAGANELTINWYTDEPSIGAIDFGLTTAYGTTETESVPTYYHSVTITGLVPGNTYHYQIRSIDDLNQEAVSKDFIYFFDPSGPTIDIWYGDTQDFGTLGNPQEFYINIFGNVSDVDGVTNLSYTLDGGSPINLSIGGDGRRLENAGDFNIDLNWTTLTEGAHTVIITATDGGGNITNKTVTVNYDAGNLWPLPYTADWNTLADDGDDTTPDPSIQTIAQVVDGKWSVDNGVISTSEPGYDRLVALGDENWDDYRVKVPVTINSTPGGFGTGLLFRWNGHTDTPVSCSQPKCGYLPLGAIGWIRNGKIEFYNTGVSQSFAVQTGTTYWFLMEVESMVGGPTYRLKVWEDGTSEPATWNLEHQESPGSPASGSLLLISHQADAEFGTVEITPVMGTPNMPPIAVDDDANVLTGGQLAVNVLSNDSDPDGSLVPGTVTIVNPPTSGIILGINPTTGAITYKHDGSASTSDSFTYTVEDNDGAVSNIAAVTMTITEDPLPNFISDDFCDNSLDPVWTFVDPLGDGGFVLTGSGTADAYAEISVPGGSAHQIFTSGIEVPHLLQSAQNTDFGVEVKFDSPVVAPQYQEQGILVKEDDNKYMRFEFFSTTAGNTHIYVQAFDLINGAPAAFINASIGNAVGAPLYLRVERVGSQWTVKYSIDGTNFPVAIVFDYDINVSAIGPYAGNALGGTSPAHTAQIDYFMNLASPLATEDDCSQQPPILDPIGDQTVEEGASLTINLNADDPDGNNNNLVFSESGLPAFATLMDNGDGTATLDIDPLAGDAGTYPVTITVTDEQTLTDEETFDILVTIPGTDPSGIVSDDFCNPVINTDIWAVNPLGGSAISLTGSGTSDALLQIDVPGGTAHEMHNTITAPHLLQSANDTDFEVEVKFESSPTQQFQEQGILVMQDATNFLRLEFYSSNTATVLYARSYGTGAATHISQTVGANGLTPPLFMRVNRTGDLWTISYSLDGTFIDGATYSFTKAISVTGIGPYAGNATGGNSPAFTGLIDYFFNTASPINPEDACDACASDTENPTIEGCPANQNVDFDASCAFTLPDYTGLLTISDNCDPNPSVVQSPTAGTIITTQTTVIITVTDASSNSDVCTFEVIPADATDPTIEDCPANQDVDFDASCAFTLPDYTGLLTISDNCDPNPSVVQSPTAGTVITTQTTVTITVTDASSNSDVCTFEVIPADATDPTIEDCPANQNVDFDASCAFTLPDYTGLLTISDNCDPNPSVVQSPTAGTVITTQTTVTITVTDAASNSDVCTFEVIPADATDPTIEDCPANQNVDFDASCAFTLPDYTGLLTISDNCDPNPSVVQSPKAGTIITTQTTVTITVTDAASNSDVCTFEVIPADATDPTIEDCPANQNVDFDASCAFTLPDYTGLLTISDNCDPNPSVVQSPTAGTVITTQTTVTITVTDAASNSDVCTFEVIPADTNDPPTANCPATKTVSNATGQCGANVSFTIPDPTDNCAAFSSANPASGSFFPVGTTTVTVTATDGTGNTGTCTFDVVVNDTENPTITCPNDITVSVQGTCGDNVAFPPPGVSDACGIAAEGGVEYMPASGSFFEVGTTLVNCIVMDVNGNSNSCSFNVILEDVEDPIPTCNNPTVTLDATGQYTLTAADVLSGGTDNCGTVNFVEASPGVLDCNDAGTTVSVTVTVNDGNGNTGTCTADVTVDGILDPPTAATASKEFCEGADLSPNLSNTGVSVSNNLSANERVVWVLTSAPFGSIYMAGDEFTTDDCGSGFKNFGELAVAASSKVIRVQDVANAPVGTYAFDAYIENCATGCISGLASGFSITINPRPSVPVVNRLTRASCLGSSSTVRVNDPGNGFTINWTVVAAPAGASFSAGDVLGAGENGADYRTNLEPSGRRLRIKGNMSVAPGTYQFQASTVNMGTGCESDLTTEIFEINIYEQPTVDITADPDGDLCLGTTGVQYDATIVSTDGGTYSYAWCAYNSGDGSGSCFDGFSDNTVQTPTRNWSSTAGAKSVGVTVESNVNGCTASNLYSFEVVAPTMVACPGDQMGTLITNPGSFDCAAVVTWDNPSVDPGPCDPVTLTIEVDGGAPETVTPGTPYTATFSDLGMYSVTYTLVDAVGNTSTCSFNVFVDGLPCGWVDNGGIDCPGSTSVYDQLGATFNLMSGECAPNSSYTTDVTAFIFTELCGDGEIIAKVDNISSGQGFAGVMARDSEAPGAPKVSIGANTTNRVRKEVRVLPNYPAFPQEVLAYDQFWVRITRTGPSFRAYASPDGVQWFPYLYQNIQMQSCILVGLYAYNERASSPITATFSNVSVNGVPVGAAAGGSGTSTFLNQDWGGSEQAAPALSIALFPNPTSGELNLDLGNFMGERADIRVFNSVGQQVMTHRVDEVQIPIERMDMSDLEAGMYHLTVRLGDRVLTERVVITK